MLIKPGVGIHLRPNFDDINIGDPTALLRRWMRANFSKDLCRKIFQEFIQEYKLKEKDGFNLACFDEDRPIGARKVFYDPKPKKWFFGFRTNCHKKSYKDFAVDIPINDVKAAANLIAGIADIDDLAKLRNDYDFFSRSTFKTLFGSQSRNSRLQIWPTIKESGIYRREHASLMISSGKTQILFDPVFLAPQGTPPMVPWLRPNLSGGRPADAIFISHSHIDHWHIPTILASLRGVNARVFVPDVSKTEGGADRFSELLKIAGVRHQSAKWGQVIKIGDIEIDILPFYGEQFAAQISPHDSGLRNWGNCFRVNTPDFSVFVLVDSGRDPLGNMLEVLESSVKKRGPADAVLACMRDVYAPFEVGGLASYFLPFTFSQLQSLFRIYKSGNLQSCAAGLDERNGLAALCKGAKAGYFLPYAQGFAGFGKRIPDKTGWGPNVGSEKVAMNILTKQLKDQKINTVAQDWNPGDFVSFKNKKIIRTKFV